MSQQPVRLRKAHFSLPTNQRYLRHLRSIAARNLIFKAEPGSEEVDVTKLLAYFTLHVDDKTKAFYTSEKIQGSLSPTWRSFLPSHLNEDLDTTAQSVVVRVWLEYHEITRLVTEWTVNFTGLVYVGDKAQKDGKKFKPNTLLFGMFDAFFGFADAEKKPAAIEDQSFQVEQMFVRHSYSANSLLRMNTIIRAIKQTQMSVKRVRHSIEDKLVSSQKKSRMLSDQEMLILKVDQLRSELERRTTKLQTEKEMYERQQSKNHQREVVLQNKHDTLDKDRNRLIEKRQSYYDLREQYLKTNAQLIMRKKQIISDLAFIYPIKETQTTVFSVCAVRLPNSEDFQGQDDTMIAIALGYTAHMVQMIAHFLDIPLRYPIDHRGSRSKIRDNITAKLPEKEREFPLYSKGKDKFQFNYGVYLLNKNIAQLRYYCGLGTTDLRLTLPNLKSLLELRLGVKFDQSSHSSTLQRQTSVSSTVSSVVGTPNNLPLKKIATPPSKTAVFKDPLDNEFEKALTLTKEEQKRVKDARNSITDEGCDMLDTSAKQNGDGHDPKNSHLSNNMPHNQELHVEVIPGENDYLIVPNLHENDKILQVAKGSEFNKFLDGNVTPQSGLSSPNSRTEEGNVSSSEENSVLKYESKFKAWQANPIKLADNASDSDQAPSGEETTETSSGVKQNENVISETSVGDTKVLAVDGNEQVSQGNQIQENESEISDIMQHNAEPFAPNMCNTFVTEVKTFKTKAMLNQEEDSIAASAKNLDDDIAQRTNALLVGSSNTSGFKMHVGHKLQDGEDCDLEG